MKNFYLLFLMIGLLLLPGCSSGPKDHQPEPTKTIYINDKGNVNLGSIELGDEWVIRTRNGILTTRQKGDKTNFMNENGQTVFSLRKDADGFKLKAGERVVVKGKWAYDNKIKLADNDEMSNAIEIKINDNEKYKISRNEILLSEFKLSFDGVNIWETEDYKFFGFEGSLSAGIIYLDQWSTLEKWIMIAVIKDAGK